MSAACEGVRAEGGRTFGSAASTGILFGPPPEWLIDLFSYNQYVSSYACGMSQRTHQFLALCSASVGAGMKRNVVDVSRILQVVQRRGDARVCHNMGRHF